MIPTALLLIAHGSRQQEANEDLHHLADQLRQDGDYVAVVASFLELAEPDIVTGGRQCVSAGARRVALVPYFLSAGVHVRRDLQNYRSQLAQEFPDVDMVLAEPLGRHPLLVDVVRERTRAALKLGFPERGT
jgi:sirohydrochlorin ferrochelatase